MVGPVATTSSVEAIRDRLPPKLVEADRRFVNDSGSETIRPGRLWEKLIVSIAKGQPLTKFDDRFDANDHYPRSRTLSDEGAA